MISDTLGPLVLHLIQGALVSVIVAIPVVAVILLVWALLVSLV